LNYFGEKKQTSHRFCSFIFFSAAQLGIKDSLTPYVFLAFLLLNVVLFAVRKWPKQCSSFGLSFIFGYMATHSFVVVGAFDFILGTPLLQQIIRWVNLALALGLIGIGAIHLRDWWMIKKGRESSVLISFHRGTENSQKALSRIKTRGFLIVIFMIGQVAALLGSPWAPDQDFYLKLKYASEGGHAERILLFTFTYSLFAAWLLWFSWIVLVLGRKSEKQFLIFKNISLQKMVLSSIFIAVGLGISYLSLK
jgi:hypothetical protein